VAKKANRESPAERFYDNLRPLVIHLVNECSQQPAIVATCDYIPSALFRDITIKKYSHLHLSDEEICAKLDSEIPQRDSPSIGLPAHWTEKFNVQTFTQAYHDPRLFRFLGSFSRGDSARRFLKTWQAIQFRGNHGSIRGSWPNGPGRVLADIAALLKIFFRS
jgi:hypothetical protein